MNNSETKRFIFLIIVMLFLQACFSSEDHFQDFGSGGKVEIQGKIERGIYFSPEKTLFYKIPKLSKPGFKITDKTDGNELAVRFIDDFGRDFQLDVYSAKKIETIEDWHLKNSNIQKNKTEIFSGYLEGESFKLLESENASKVFVTIDVPREPSKDFKNEMRVTSLVMANGKIYAVSQVVNRNVSSIVHDMISELSDGAISDALTDEQKINAGKVIAIENLKNLLVVDIKSKS